MKGKIRNVRTLSGKKIKVNHDQDVHHADLSNENISIKIPMFEINNECIQATINEQFDVLQAREEIIGSKNALMDCDGSVKVKAEGSKFKRGRKSQPQAASNSEVSDDLEIEMKPLAKWAKYQKLYKSHWENDPHLKEWIRPQLDDPGKVSCQWCKCTLRAHKADLYKHAGTKKHRRSNFNLSSDGIEINNGIVENSKEISFSVSPKRSKKRRIKSEKIPTNDGSYIILQTEQNTPAYHDEPDNENIYMDFTDNDIREGVSFNDTRSVVQDHDISAIANRIGVVLVEEIERILRSEKNILKYFKEGEEIPLTDSNVKRMAKICVGKLSQKYLVESALEPPRLKSESASKENKELTTKFRSIEEKLEKTVMEMKDLKMSFDGVSQVLPFTQIDLGEIFHSAPTN